MSEQMQFNASLEELPNMLRWIRTKLKDFSFSSGQKNKFEVVSEEILVNIIHYAYGETKGIIEMEWEQKGPFVKLSFKDFGKPFNPLQNQKPVIKSLSVDSKEIGGLGIFFMKNLVDNVEYLHKEGANHLIIKMRVS